MATIHDGTAYSQQLQQAACEQLVRLGGECLAQIQVTSGQNMTPILRQVAALNPDVLYLPVYTVDGVAITNGAKDAGLVNTALISSDGLLSSDFISQTYQSAQGMYLSGPAPVKESQAFLETYKTRYGEDPIASYSTYGYDAAMMLIGAMEQVGALSGETVYIPRQALRDALYGIRGMKGLSGVLTCSTSGDCASPNIQIFQIIQNEFVPIYP